MPADGRRVRPRTSFVGRRRHRQRARPHRTQDAGEPRRSGRSRQVSTRGGVGFIAASAWADGVWLVDLAPLAGGELVPVAVAAALGVRAGATDPLHEVVEHLRSRSALIVVDNCEHVLDACAEVVTSILAAPAVGVLVTSREPLRIPGGDLARSAGDTKGRRARAGSGARRFGCSCTGNCPAIVLIGRRALCRDRHLSQLDGLPLALRMAAASSRSIAIQSPAGLEDRFLRSPGRDRSRHRPWRRCSDGVTACSAPTSAALRRLSLLPAGFTIDIAMVAVADGATASAASFARLVARRQSPATADLSTSDRPVLGLARCESSPRRQRRATAVASRLRPGFSEGWALGSSSAVDRARGRRTDNFRAVVTMLVTTTSKAPSSSRRR